MSSLEQIISLLRNFDFKLKKGASIDQISDVINVVWAISCDIVKVQGYQGQDIIYYIITETPTIQNLVFLLQTKRQFN